MEPIDVKSHPRRRGTKRQQRGPLVETCLNSSHIDVREEELYRRFAGGGAGGGGSTHQPPSGGRAKGGNGKKGAREGGGRWIRGVMESRDGEEMLF